MEHIILFDGVCNLCSASVQFIIKRDRAGRFSFASLQSGIGQQLSAQHGIDAADLDSIVLVEGGKAYQRSTAALRIGRHLDGAWKLLYAGMIVPPFIRDRVYDYVATNRYNWFGEQTECWIPTAALRGRFL